MNRLLGLLATVLGVLLVATGSAQAAFPGQNGLLVLQPLHGSGLELVDTHGQGAQVICTDRTLCGQPSTPRFAPDGLNIVFTDRRTGHPAVVAGDGTCMWCLLGPRITSLTASAAAFAGSGQALTLAGPRGLWRISLIGARAKELQAGAIQDAVSSAHGTLAFVVGGSIWVQPPGRGARWLAFGSQPTFAPNGRRLAFVHRGWIWSIGVHGGHARRLVRGSSPAFSPDGQELAFIGRGGRVYVGGVRGRRARQVPGVRASSIDWQPLPARAAACAVPPGQQVVAQTPEAVITTLQPFWWGCLVATGKRRLLVEQTGSALSPAVGAFQLAGRFAAVALNAYDQYGNCTDSVARFDLATGTQTTLYSLDCGNANRGVDSVAVDSSGFTAWHAFEQLLVPQPLVAAACATVSFCVAGDALGNLASSSSPTGASGAWSLSKVVPSFGGPIACYGTSLCVASSGASVVSSTDPSGGAGSWSKPTSIDSSHLIARIACPSTSLCVAVDNAGNVLTSTDPGAATPTWTTTNETSGFLTGISCPSTSLCVAVGANGVVLTSNNPGAATPAWTPSAAEPGVFALGGVSCPSIHLCVATDSNGNVLTEDPSGAGTWTVAPLPVNPGISPIAPSCAQTAPTKSLCLISYGAGVIVSSDPTTASSWSATPLITGTSNHLAALTCAPTGTLCLATDQNGNVLTSTDPAAAAPTWTTAAVEIPACGACIAEQVYALDDRGRLALDTVQPGPGQVLGNLALAGNSTVLSWTHSGQAESAQLH